MNTLISPIQADRFKRRRARVAGKGVVFAFVDVKLR